MNATHIHNHGVIHESIDSSISNNHFVDLWSVYFSARILTVIIFDKNLEKLSVIGTRLVLVITTKVIENFYAHAWHSRFGVFTETKGRAMSFFSKKLGF